MTSSWQEVRATRPPREDRVAEYRAAMDAAVRACQPREIIANFGDQRIVLG